MQLEQRTCWAWGPPPSLPPKKAWAPVSINFECALTYAWKLTVRWFVTHECSASQWRQHICHEDCGPLGEWLIGVSQDGGGHSC